MHDYKVLSVSDLDLRNGFSEVLLLRGVNELLSLFSFS